MIKNSSPTSTKAMTLFYFFSLAFSSARLAIIPASESCYKDEMMNMKYLALCHIHGRCSVVPMLTYNNKKYFSL